jgi:hypothetical protein
MQTGMVKRVVQVVVLVELLAFLELGEVVLLTKDLLAVIHPQVAQAQVAAVAVELEQQAVMAGLAIQVQAVQVVQALL